jgi:hypothetical protein
MLSGAYFKRFQALTTKDPSPCPSTLMLLNSSAKAATASGK